MGAAFTCALQQTVDADWHFCVGSTWPIAVSCYVDMRLIWFWLLTWTRPSLRLFDSKQQLEALLFSLGFYYYHLKQGQCTAQSYFACVMIPNLCLNGSFWSIQNYSSKASGKYPVLLSSRNPLCELWRIYIVHHAQFLALYMVKHVNIYISYKYHIVFLLLVLFLNCQTWLEVEMTA